MNLSNNDTDGTESSLLEKRFKYKLVLLMTRFLNIFYPSIIGFGCSEEYHRFIPCLHSH